jgi:hypothetical protein
MGMCALARNAHAQTSSLQLMDECFITQIMAVHAPYRCSSLYQAEQNGMAHFPEFSRSRKDCFVLPGYDKPIGIPVANDEVPRK